MFGKGITREVPNDEFLALINANTPSGVNPFATMADIAGIIPITVVLNYAALPDPTTVNGHFYYVEESQGTSWLPGSLGGTYYPLGLYYSNGVSWIVTEVPYQATQAEVDYGLDTNKFVTPETLKNSSQWGDYLPLAGGIMDSGAIIQEANGSKLKEGTTDSALGGNKGIALVCSIDYELKWEAGRLYVLQQDGFTIREVLYNFTITPTVSDDDLKGFVIGSRWMLDNGDFYVCTGATTGAAVWVLETSGGGGGSLPTGGTAGQILTKVDATDYNATWQENYAEWTSVVKHTVKNDGTGLITKGTAVYVTGSNGTNMLVGKASNTSEATSSKTMGLMQSNITTTGGTQTGFVITEGLLGGLNTAGQTAGDPVWLGVNGALIYGLVNKPYAPAHLVFIGIVTKVSAGSGEIFVKVQNGFELKEIHDVDLITNSPTNNQGLIYETSSSLWKNKTIIEDSITNGVTDKAPSQNAVFDALALKQDTLVSNTNIKTVNNVSILGSGNISTTPFKQNTASSLTGTILETIITSILIPANTFQSNDWLNWLISINATNNANSKILKFYFNTSASLSGAVQVAQRTLAGAITQTVSRNMFFKNSVSSQRTMIGVTLSAPSDEEGNTGAAADLSINFGVDQYFIVSGTIVVITDTITINGLTSRINR